MIEEKQYSSTVISSRLRKTEEKYKLLCDAYESVLDLVTDSEIVALFDKQFGESEVLYNQIDAISRSYLKSEDTNLPTENSQNLSRLPQINLPVFDGDIFSWSSFISLYSSLVLSRKDISKTEKFHYLISHVKNESFGLIKHLPMVDDSLETALTILEGRYENKRLLADSHIARILNLPFVSKGVDLRMRLLNPLLESTRALQNYGFPIDHWSYILLHISLTKLPNEIKTRFEHKYGGNISVLPTFDQLVEFLQYECRLIDNASSDHNGNNFNTRNVKSRETRDSRPYSGKHKAYHANTATSNSCFYCRKSGHNIINCYQFLKLDTYERKRFIMTKRLCFKCLEEHTASSCNKSVPCVNCKHTGHNKLICTMTITRKRSVSPKVNNYKLNRTRNKCDCYSDSETASRKGSSPRRNAISGSRRPRVESCDDCPIGRASYDDVNRDKARDISMHSQ